MAKVDPDIPEKIARRKIPGKSSSMKIQMTALTSPESDGVGIRIIPPARPGAGCSMTTNGNIIAE